MTGSRRRFQHILLAALMLLLPTVAALANGLPDFTGLVEQYGPAVVNISTTSKPPQGTRPQPHIQIPNLPEDSPLHDFFRHFFGDQGGLPDSRPRSSLGSGFIVSRDGYVITNNHVIKDADEIVVRLSDRREFAAKLVGQDGRSDIAVLKIEAGGLPVLKIGDSDRLKVGEWVLAIGSPFGFDHSVTAGIVSAKGRNLPNENYVPFIQTDVAINPGNSGGPLMNLDGEVVGVNSQIFSRTGGFMGLSFAIPVKVVMNVYRQLVDKGEVTRGWLGVLIQDVTAELAQSFHMARPKGALVAKVMADSPAARAGFKVGDIIVRYDGQEIDHSGDLPPMVGATPVDSRVPVDIIRNGEQRRLTVGIGPLPKEQENTPGPGKPGVVKGNRIGITLEAISEAQRKQMELGDQGVVVAGVGEGPAREAGIRAGDIILMLDNHKIRSPAQFLELLRKLPAGVTVPVLIQRGQGPAFLALKIPEE